MAEIPPTVPPPGSDPGAPREEASARPHQDSETLSRSAGLLAERRARAAREEPRALSTAVLVIGLGWVVVLPTLLGVFVGRYLDRRFATGVQLTAGLSLLGLCYGCVLAWSRITHRPKDG